MVGCLLLIKRKLSGRCGINCGKAACRMSTACLQGGGGGGVSEKCGKNSNVAKFSVLEDMGISERCGKQCGHERASVCLLLVSAGRCQEDVV